MPLYAPAEHKKMKIGLIAGGGQFPLIFSRKAKKQGYGVYAVGFHRETDPMLAETVDVLLWLHLGQLRRLIKFFRQNGVTEAVMLGTIQKTRIFTDVKPDMRAITLMARLRHTHDDGLLRLLAAELAREGIQIRASTFLLPELLAPAGCWTKRRPNRGERQDIELGWQVAKAVGALDVGQSVVVGGGTVLAVEAIEGTDAAIQRGAGLAKGNAVVVKVCKPSQDLRFDIPAVGLKTIETMQSAGARVLALEAGKAVVFDRPEMISRADEWGIAVVALEKP